LNYLPSSLAAAQSDLLPMADWLHVYRWRRFTRQGGEKSSRPIRRL